MREYARARREGIKKSPEIGKMHVEAPCGTDTAYRRHLKNGEKPCKNCREAYALRERVKRWARSFQGVDDVECGTPDGYRFHVVHNEEPCDSCHEAFEIQRSHARNSQSYLALIEANERRARHRAEKVWQRYCAFMSREDRAW